MRVGERNILYLNRERKDEIEGLKEEIRKL